MTTTTFGTNSGDTGNGATCWLQQGAPTTNFGANVTMSITQFGAGDYDHGLVRFNLANTIPPTANISAVQVKLFLDSIQTTSGTFTVTLKRSLRVWSQLQATWNAYVTGSNWTNGGGVGSPDSFTTVDASLLIGNGPAGSYFTWGSTANLIATVANCVAAGTDPSWVIERSDAEEGESRRFVSTTGNTGQRPQLLVTWTATSQTLTPSADSITGNWVASIGTTLFGVIDETVRDDTDYALLSGIVGSTFKVALSTANDPLISTNHVVSYTIEGTGGNMNVRLVQDANTTIAQWAHTNLTQTYTQYDQTLSNAQADSITAYGNLFLEFRAF